MERCPHHEALRILRGSYGHTRLSTPTRMLVGASDPVVCTGFLGGYEDHTDDLTIETIEGTSHWVADERPDVVIERALEFFARS